MNRLARLADTIVAPVTASGRAAIAVVRVSGPAAWQIASRVFSPWPPRPRSHRAYFGRYAHGDEGLALCFAEGRGFTGEPAVEFSLHGSPASVRALLDACEAAGARSAAPGEFTYRAFMHGRLDLTQAAGVLEGVEAATASQLRHAASLRRGSLREQVTAIRNDLVGVLAAVEASVDFSDEIGELDQESALVRLAGARASITRLLDTVAAGAILRDGLRIALVGLPNAGKSSLMNALLGFERAIVTPNPGTTRDLIEENCELGGLLCVLIDTAGLRETEDQAEAIGVRLALSAAARADQVWYLIDSARGWSDEDARLATSLPAPPMVVATKTDLAPPPPEATIAVSARTGEGLPLLAQVAANSLEGIEGPILSSHQVAPLTDAVAALEQAELTLRADLPVDLVAVDLRAAISALGEVTGETASEDMIERIFRDFCVGK
jgi:tRNA modification GTPase